MTQRIKPAYDNRSLDTILKKEGSLNREIISEHALVNPTSCFFMVLGGKSYRISNSGPCDFNRLY